jgi:hypothetical protein
MIKKQMIENFEILLSHFGLRRGVGDPPTTYMSVTSKLFPYRYFQVID